MDSSDEDIRINEYEEEDEDEDEISEEEGEGKAFLILIEMKTLYLTLNYREFRIRREEILFFFGCFSLLHVLIPDFFSIKSPPRYLINFQAKNNS